LVLVPTEDELSGAVTKNSNYADLHFTHLLTGNISTPLCVLFTVMHDMMSLTTN